jgi:hypothetical protein
MLVMAIGMAVTALALLVGVVVAVVVVTVLMSLCWPRVRCNWANCNEQESESRDNETLHLLSFDV